MSRRSTELNANLTKGSANIADVLHLLRLWDPDEETPSEFEHRAMEENLLGKTSRSRAGDVIRNVFGRRYFPDGCSHPAERLRRLVISELPRSVLDRLLYYHAALAERLLYRSATELVYDHRTRGVDVVRKADVRRFLSTLEAEGAIPTSYSESVSDRLAKGVLAALRDFRVLIGKSRKRVAPVQVPDEVVAYLAYALKEEGQSAKRIVEHEDWKLFLLHPREAEERIMDVSGLGHYEYRAAGDIRRFDWRYDSLDEYVEAIARA